MDTYAYISKTIHPVGFTQKHRKKKTDFTRTQVLTFPTLISFHLNLIKGSLQTELNNFFQHKNNHKILTQVVSSSAFGKARKKYSETAFIELLQGVTKRFYHNRSLKKWSGFRVLAVDGSKYLLPNKKSLHTTFGGMTNQFKKCIQWL